MKHQAKNVFPSDVERTVKIFLSFLHKTEVLCGSSIEH